MYKRIEKQKMKILKRLHSIWGGKLVVNRKESLFFRVFGNEKVVLCAQKLKSFPPPPQLTTNDPECIPSE